MVSVIVTADDCFDEDYIIDNQPVGPVAKTHKIVRRPLRPLREVVSKAVSC